MTRPHNKDRMRIVARYAMALASVGAGLAVRIALGSALGVTVPYITFIPAVMWASWFGGLGPGILASTLSLLTALYLIVPPAYQLRPATVADLVGATIFFAVSIFITVLNEALRRSRARSDERFHQLAAETARRTSAEGDLAEARGAAERGRDLLYTTLSSIGDAVIAADAGGAVTFLNTAAQELTGWSQADAVGKPVQTIFVIRDDPTPRTGPSNHHISDPTILVARDGREIPVEHNAAPIRDGKESVLGVVLVFRDVTGRRKSEEERRRSEERLELALDAGQIGVWDWDVLLNRVECSDRVYDICGLGQGQFGGHIEDFTGLIHPDDRVRVQAGIHDALHRGAPFNVEFRVLHTDGKVRWVFTTALVLRDDLGKPVRMLGAATDITPRKQAEAHLRQQWHTFDTALSNTPDFTYILDLDGRFTYVNRALLSLWQKPLEEARGKNFFELEYPPELAARLQSQIQQVIESRQPLRDQTPFTGPTGETRNYEYIFVPVFAVDGSVEAVTGSTRDVTERARAEEALRKSEERLVFALEAGGGVGTWDWDISADRVFCTPQFAKLYSMDPQRGAEGVPLAEFVRRVHADDGAHLEDQIRQAVNAGEDFAAEYRVVQVDGSIRWIYARGRCHHNDAGEPVRFPGVAFDVTQRKGAEQALEQSQNRLRAIYDGTYGHIGLLAPDGTLLEANRASLTFAGLTRDDVVGRPFWDTPWFTATPGAPDSVRACVARAAAGEFVRFEAVLRRPSAECPTFDISLHPVRNERGEVILIVPEGRDITERKRVEEDLRSSNAELQRVNRELEEFAYVASHDLQEPLRMVNIYTELILREMGQDGLKLGQFAGFVRQGVTRMGALIRDLLTFSSAVHSDRMPFGTANLSESLDDALSVLTNRLEDSGSRVECGPLPTVRGDASQLTHVFQNLVSNALKYRRENVPPEIRITSRPDGDEWIVTVQDNGIGFEQQYAERIFGLFKRLHKDEYPGTGLGLAICRRIVERYGGRIWAEGVPGEGSSFHFALPAGHQDPLFPDTRVRDSDPEMFSSG
jgi:PAS domain S-box-containing protein